MVTESGAFLTAWCVEQDMLVSSDIAYSILSLLNIDLIPYRRILKPHLANDQVG